VGSTSQATLHRGSSGLCQRRALRHPGVRAHLPVRDAPWLQRGRLDVLAGGHAREC